MTSTTTRTPVTMAMVTMANRDILSWFRHM